MAEKVIIPLGGMTNVPDANVSKDGDMQLLVNMRHIGSDVSQVAAPTSKTIEGIEAVYRHAAADRLLGISEDGKLYDITGSVPVDLRLGEVYSPLSMADVRKEAGENSIPKDGGNAVAFGDYAGFGKCIFYSGNGLLKVVADKGYEDVLDFSTADNQPWAAYRFQVKYIRIEGFSRIGANAFRGCAAQAVVIPDGVTEIAEYAFASTRIAKLFLPPSVTEIDANAFLGCEVTDLYLMERLDDIGDFFPNLPTVHKNHGVTIYYNGEVVVMQTLAYAGVESLSFFGNIVQVRCGDRIVYALWSSGEYRNLGEFPRELAVQYNMSVDYYSLLAKSRYYTAAQAMNDSLANKEDVIWNYVAAGFYDQLLDTIYHKRLYVDNALFIVAARLFDGSYVQLSQPIFVRDPGERHEFALQLGAMSYNPLYYLYNAEATEYQKYEASNPYYMGGQEDNFKAFASYSSGALDAGYYAPVIRAMDISIKLAGYDWSDWKDFVSGIEVFTTGSIMMHKKRTGAKSREVVSSGLQRIAGPSSKEYYGVKRAQEFYEEVANAALYYRVASYDLKGNLIQEIDNTSPSTLAVQQRLEKLIAPHSFTRRAVETLYNSREHQAGVVKRYYNGYPMQVLSGENVGTVHIVTEIERPAGDIKVMRTMQDFRFPAEGIGPLFTYPDSSVKRLTLYFEGISKQIVCEMKTGAMFAYYLHTERKETEKYSVSVRECRQGETVINGVSIMADTFVGKLRDIGFTGFDGQEVDITVDAEGKVMVYDGVEVESLALLGIEITDDNYNAKAALSLTVAIGIYVMQENIVKPIRREELTDWGGVLPDIAPMEEIGDTLYVSEVDNPFYFPNTYKFDGDIVAMASSTEEVSSGQFGQYPMYVFTTEGIWALGVDTGGQGAYVTQTPVSREVCTGEVCPIAGGVVFATAKGIMLISGAKVVNLSAALDSTNDGQSEIITKIAALAGIDVSLVKFRTYIQGCVIAYNYLYNEIIVSNTKYKYSYVYSLDNAMWSIVDRVYESRVNSYPDLMMYDKDKIYSFIERTTSAPILCMTRPIKVSTTNHKRVKEAALRGTWEGKMYFYVLGSNDGEKWALLGGCERKETAKHRDLVASVPRSKSYRYIAFACASPDFKGRLSMVELLVTDGIGDNGLR